MSRSSRSLGGLFRGNTIVPRVRPNANALSKPPNRPAVVPFTASYQTTTPKIPSPQYPDATLNLRRLTCILTFGGLGWFVAKHTAVLEPGSPEDLKELEGLRRYFFHEGGIVEKMREAVVGLGVEEWEPYGNYTEEEKRKRLTSGAMAGSRGISMQRVWYNESGGVAGTVVHLGNGIEGWPFTVHGGALATILDECMGRVAILNLPARTAVTANLNINYRNMARSGQAYFVLVHIDRSASTDRKAIVTGKIYNQNSDLCVEAVGTFVVPRNYQLKELEAKF